MVDLKSNEHTTKPEIASKRCTREDSNQSFIVFRSVKSLEARRRTSDGLKSFADAWSTSHKKTTHTMLLGKNEKDTKRGGR